MPIYALGAVEPEIHPDAYVHPDAVVVGDITLGAEARVRAGHEVPEGATEYAMQCCTQRGKRCRDELQLLER